MTEESGGAARRGRGGLRRGRPSSYDVAALAGVSQSAVSRAFRPGAYLSDELRQKVLSAAETLGFRPNAMARGLATSRSGIVALAIGTFSNPIYPSILKAFSGAVAARGLQLLLLTEFDDPDAAMRRILQYEVDAVVLTASLLLDPSRVIATRCRAAGVPVVLYNRMLPGQDVPAVVCANRAGGRLVAELLLRAGHRRLAFLGGPEETSANADRRDGFREAAAMAGAAPPLLEVGSYTYEGGHAALLRLMRQPDPPDAVFCTNDLLAIGAIDAARRELRLSVPGDLSIIGFDDVPMAAWASYDLTTIRQRIPAMVERTVEAVMRAIEGAEPAGLIEVEGDLVRRGSARLPPHHPDAGIP